MLPDKATNSNSQLSSSTREKNELSVQSNAESSDNLSSLMQKSRQDSSTESKLSKKVAIDLQTSGKTSNSLPESLSKDKDNNINKINSSKNGTIDIQSSKEKSGSLSTRSKVKESDNISFSSINSSIKDGKPESISSSFSNMVVNIRSGNSEYTNAKGTCSHVSYKPEIWILPQQVEDTLTQLNLSIVCKWTILLYAPGKYFLESMTLKFLVCLL